MSCTIKGDGGACALPDEHEGPCRRASRFRKEAAAFDWQGTREELDAVLHSMGSPGALSAGPGRYAARGPDGKYLSGAEVAKALPSTREAMARKAAQRDLDARLDISIARRQRRAYLADVVADIKELDEIRTAAKEELARS